MVRMTKGSVSIIRSTEEAIKAAEAAGFKIDGECDADGNLVPVIKATPDEAKPRKAKK